MSNLKEQIAEAVESGKFAPLVDKAKGYYSDAKPAVMPTVRIETVTPKMAANWLKKNGLPQKPTEDGEVTYKNRLPKGAHIAQMAGMMKAGIWYLNGETLKFGPKDELLDGQNRLYACVAADAPFETFVVRNIPYAAFETIDTGKARSPADVLNIHGAEYASWISAGIRLLEAVRKGVSSLDARTSPLETVQRWRDSLTSATPLTDSALAVRAAVSGKIIRPAIAIACHQLFSEKDRPAADAFFNDLGKGVGLQETDPVYHLRQRLMRAATDKRQRMRNEEIMTLCIRAWNNRREGLEVKRLQGMSKRKDGSYGPVEVE